MDEQIKYLRACLEEGADRPLTEKAHQYFTEAVSTLGEGDAQLEFGHIAADAAQYCREDIVEGLLSAGCELTSSMLEGAMIGKSIAVFEVLLHYGREQGRWDINKPWRNLDQPWRNDSVPMLGHISPDRDLTVWFFDQGADPNVKDKDDITPFSLAVQHASEDIIKLFLEKGGLLHQGWLLHHAVARDYGEDEVMKFLVEKLEEGKYDVVGWLNAVKYSDNPALSDFYRYIDLGTPLHDAATQGKGGLVCYLIDKGADRYIQDSLGLTAEACVQDCLQAEKSEEKRGRLSDVLELLQNYFPEEGGPIADRQRNDSLYPLDDKA